MPSAIAISSSTNLAALFSEPAVQHHLGSLVAEFDPAGLDVIDRAVQPDSGQGDRDGRRQLGLGAFWPFNGDDECDTSRRRRARLHRRVIRCLRRCTGR